MKKDKPKKEVDEKAMFIREKNIQSYCRACDTFFERKEIDLEAHALLHEESVVFCTYCSKIVKTKKLQKHFLRKGCNDQNIQRKNLSKLLFEYRLVVKSNTSRFYGSSNNIPSFRQTMKKLYRKDGNIDHFFVFRSSNSKLLWSCILCENFNTISCLDSISLRCCALNHLIQHHSSESEAHKAIIEEEWDLLCEETNFDLKSLMKVARTRSTLLKQSRQTFYTVDLATFENGSNFEKELMNRGNLNPSEKYRYCLICCSLVISNSSSLGPHFRLLNHYNLESNQGATIFFQKEKIKKEDDQQNDEENQVFVFPNDLFSYETVYKTVKNDIFKWRCCLCENARAHTFVTFVVLRMFALRHIDQHHSYLFTDEFLDFEWSLVKSDVHADFDVRNYNPRIYTIRGQNTFDSRNPNDYTLPQQFYFIPVAFFKNTLICGFCYRSLRHGEFIHHIACHGYRKGGKTIMVKGATKNEITSELMGQARYDRNKIREPPLNNLSKEGEKLKAKLELITERCVSSLSSCSSVPQTPTKRKSAVNARVLMNRTIEILRENKRRSTENERESDAECSSSSCSSDSAKDKTFELDKRKKKLKKYREKSITPTRILNKEVKKENNSDDSEKSPEVEKGVEKWLEEKPSLGNIGYKQLNNNNGNEQTENGEIVNLKTEHGKAGKLGDEKTDRKPLLTKTPLKRKRIRRDTVKSSSPPSKFDKMRPEDIKKMLKSAAKDRGVTLVESPSSSPSESSEDENHESVKMPKLDGKVNIRAMRPSQIRKWIRSEAKSRGIEWKGGSSSSSSSSE